MNWIKQNPFLSILLGSTLVLCGLLAFIATKGGSKYKEAKKDFDSDYREVAKFEKLDLYPTSDNSQAKKKALDDYSQSLDELSELYAKYQIDTSKKITIEQFAENFKKAKEEVVKVFSAAESKLPADFFMGFEVYNGKLAKTGSTALLDYELNAIKHVLLGMAAARPSELIHIYRETIPEENDVKYVPAENEVARSLSCEIVFKGSEASVRDFINKLGEKDSYYCVIRSIRINNERDTPPRISDAKFEKPPEAANAANPFGAFFQEAPAPAPAPGPAPVVAPQPEGGAPVVAPQPEGGAPEVVAPPAPVEAAPIAPVAPPAGKSVDTSSILYQVLGDEELEVFIRFDILLFLPKEAPAKP
jgi:hypothetical protein